MSIEYDYSIFKLEQTIIKGRVLIFEKVNI